MKYKKKYSLGIQQVAVPAKGGIDDLLAPTTGMAQMGNQLGSTFGPVGGAVGTGVGAAVGLVKGISDASIAKRANEIAKNNNEYIRTNQRADDNTVQTWQAKNGMNIGKSKKIEVERDELIFSKRGGKYRLKADFKGGKTHEQGGEDYVAKEGDVIYPGKMRSKVISAYKRRDTAALESMRLKLPKDSPNGKFPDGVKDYKEWIGGIGNNNNSLSVNPFLNDTQDQDDVQGDLQGMNDALGTKTVSNDIINPSNKTTTGFNVSGSLNNVVQAAPSIYNTIKGTFGKPAGVNQRFIKSDKYKYIDTSAPDRAASNEALVAEKYNAGLVAGSRGQQQSYLAQAEVGNYRRMNKINAIEAEKKNTINNMNTQLTNSDKAINLELANNYDQTVRQQKGKKSEYLGKGLEGFSNLSQNQELMDNQKKADDIRANLSYSKNYKYNPETGKIEYVYRRGSKGVKMKSC